MKREQLLRRRLQSQQSLWDAVSAMKSLSAHHFRLGRAALPAARAYRAAIDAALADVGAPVAVAATSRPALLVLASDLGLCDGYNSRLVREALARSRELQVGSVYCVGRRAAGPLGRAAVPVARLYSAPTSVSGLTQHMMQLAQEILSDHLSGVFSSLYVVSARFEGVGAFTPVCVRIWPPPPATAASPLRRSKYVSGERLRAVVLREFLYIVLYQTWLEALAAEHSTRLVAATSAAQWLEDRIAESRRDLAAIRREASTQELLDIVSGARRQTQLRESGRAI